MNYFLRYWIFLFLSLFLLPSVQATHIVGGNISYRCLGTDPVTGATTFEIRMYVYRDAINGQAPFDNPANLGIFELDAVGNFNFYQSLPISNPVVTNIPPDLSNPCLIPPSNVAVEEGYYVTTVTLPFDPQGYMISYQRCCRNNTINNLPNPGSIGASYAIFISPLAQQNCNNSPTYDNFPPIVICQNEPLVFDHSATDLDGHSITYSLCDPYTGGSQFNPAPTIPSTPTSATPPYYPPVTFGPGFSATFPMPASPALSIDPITGQMTGTPTQQGQYVVGVCMEERDANGNLLSVTLRDFQFNVAPCTNVIDAAIQNDGISPNGQAFLINSCDNNTISFVNQSTDVNFINAYSWSFDLQNGTTATSTQTNPTITFPGPNTYSGTLVVNPGQQGCTDSTEILVNVFPPRESDFGFSIDSCNVNNPSIQFTDSSQAFGNNSIVAWNWNFGDGNSSTQPSPSHAYSVIGTYNVTLTVEDVNGCTDALSQTLDWYPPAEANFNIPNPTGCAPHTVNFINQSLPFSPNAGYTLEWDFGDGSPGVTTLNPSHTYSQPGSYDVTLVTTSPWGCRDTLLVTNAVQVFDQPNAAFTDDVSCTLQPVTFSNTSSLTTGSGFSSLLWDFGDGNAGSGPSVSNNYANAGTFAVTLVATDNNGCRDTLTQNIDWFPSPAIDIQTSFSGCRFDTLTFTNNSFPSNGYSYNWQFGDGGTSGVNSPTHNYSAPGSYITSLTMTSPTGCSSDYIDTFFVRDVPTANFTSSYDSCVIDSVIFTDLSVPNPSNDPIVDWFWDFGDGNTSTLENPRHLYVTAGVFPAALTVTDTFGCSDTYTDSVYWFPAPVVDVQIASAVGCAPYEVFFDNQSYPLNGYTTDWQFGDGGSDTVASPTYTYQTPGVYIVNLLITSPTGCQETFSDTITVHERPDANFSFNFDPCEIAPVTFTDLSSTNAAGDALTSWYWDFDDGNDSTDTDPVHLYGLAGAFDVSLVVTDTNGCTDTSTQTVPWFPAPIVDVDVSDSVGCQPLTVDFINNSYPINGYSTVWDFGDGGSDTTASPTHTYLNPGIFTVDLFITSPSGCTANFLDTIVVHEVPTANFSSSFDSCSLDGVQFTDLSLPNANNDNIVQWIWDFGDGSSSSQPSPLQPYALGNTYNPSLIVVDVNGCSDTIGTSILYDPAPVFDIGSLDTAFCFGPNLGFSNNPNNNAPGYTFTWDFGDSSSSTAFEPTHTYAQPGTYPISLTINTPAQCVRNFEGEVVVHRLPEASFESSFDPCVFGPVTFNSTSTSQDGSLQAWFWDFGDGQVDTSTQNSTLHQYAFPDTLRYNVELRVEDSNGCRDSLVQETPWLPKPVYPVTLEGSKGCIPHSIPLPANNPYPVTNYQTFWTFGDGRSSEAGNPGQITYNEAGVYERQLVVLSEAGCLDTFQSVHNALPVPIADFSYAPQLITSQNPEVSFTDESTDAGAWLWDFGDDSPITGWNYQTNPIHTYQDTGFQVVQLIVTHPNGCTDTTQQRLDVIPRYSYFLPNAFTPNNDGKNDGFRGKGITEFLSDFSMQIYNRWGELIFETNDPQQSWDGTHRGKPCKAGVYVYVVEFDGPRGAKERYKGFATLIY